MLNSITDGSPCIYGRGLGCKSDAKWLPQLLRIRIHFFIFRHFFVFWFNSCKAMIDCFSLTYFSITSFILSIIIQLLPYIKRKNKVFERLLSYHHHIILNFISSLVYHLALDTSRKYIPQQSFPNQIKQCYEANCPL